MTRGRSTPDQDADPPHAGRSDASRPALRVQILVIGSGAGGAVTAATLAARGYEIALLEEGPDVDTATLASNSPEAIARLYRSGGMTPILGSQNIAYVEGRCVGGSTEINSAFWHRLPPDSYYRWRTDALLADFTPEILEPYFEQLEADLSVSYLAGRAEPKSSALFRKGIEQLGWRYAEVPRCVKSDGGANPFAAGNKQSMQRTYVPRAIEAGARLIRTPELAGCYTRTAGSAAWRWSPRSPALGIHLRRGRSSTAVLDHAARSRIPHGR